MLRHGTGTVETRAGYHLNEIDGMKVLRVQTQCCEPMEVVSTLLLQIPPGANPQTWAAQLCEEYLPLVRRRRLARFVDLELDPYTLPVPIALNILEVASQLGLYAKASSSILSASTAAVLATRGGVMALGTVHQATREELDALAAASVLAVLKPGLSFQIGAAYKEPGRAIIDSGVIPALASAYHAELSPGYNMQFILLLACRLYGWRPEEAISAATINSAYALRAEASIGSIETGKQGDVLILNVSDYREVCYHAGINVVDKVVKRGAVLYDSKSSAYDDDPD
jgi:imidazolonepropionase